MGKVCYLDLDGVLVDFVSGALREHNRTLPAKDVRWDFPGQIGFVQGAKDPLFWAPLGYQFWATLDWTPEGRALLAGVETIFGEENVVLMTSPCATDGAVEGKVAWIKRRIPQYSRRFFVGPCKHLAAGPGKILIDDHDDNCAKFALGGGVALTPPRPWNMRIGESDDEGRFDVLAFLDEVRVEAGR